MRLLPSGRAVLRMNGVASRRLTSFLPLWRRCGQLVIQPQGFPRCNLHRLQPFTARCTASVLERDNSWESVHLLRRCFARAWLRCLTDHSSTRGHAHSTMLLAAAPAPPAWLALEAQLCKALSSSGTRGARKLLLDKHLQPEALQPPQLPDSAADHRCVLAGTLVCRLLRDPGLCEWLKGLFHTIHISTSGRPGLAQVQLSQYDLFHAHLFVSWGTATEAAQGGLPVEVVRARQDDCELAPHTSVSADACSPSGRDHPSSGTGWSMGSSNNPPVSRLGLLFHAKEYPALCPEAFPYHLGYCQVGSDVRADARAMDQRNILWYQDSLHVLDVSPGGLLHHSLLWPGLEPLRTIQESDLGLRVCDLTYLPAWEQLYVTM